MFLLFFCPYSFSLSSPLPVCGGGDDDGVEAATALETRTSDSAYVQDRVPQPPPPPVIHASSKPGVVGGIGVEEQQRSAPYRGRHPRQRIIPPSQDNPPHRFELIPSKLIQPSRPASFACLRGPSLRPPRPQSRPCVS